MSENINIMNTQCILEAKKQFQFISSNVGHLAFYISKTYKKVIRNQTHELNILQAEIEKTYNTAFFTVFFF